MLGCLLVAAFNHITFDLYEERKTNFVKLHIIVCECTKELLYSNVCKLFVGMHSDHG